MAVQVPLTVTQANDITVDLAVTDSNGNPEDCTNLNAVMVIKPGRNAADSSGSELTIGDGLLWTDQVTGTLTASLGHEVLAVPGTLWWRLDLLDSDLDRTTAVYGPLIVVAV